MTGCTRVSSCGEKLRFNQWKHFKAELFSDTTINVNGLDIRVYRYSRQTRHHLANDVSFMINEYWGISLKHEYGSLPPVFNMVKHKVSVGLTFKLKEN